MIESFPSDDERMLIFSTVQDGGKHLIIPTFGPDDLYAADSPVTRGALEPPIEGTARELPPDDTPPSSDK